ncbi:hypothetical protein AN958_04094 [Leucoagaricus sp. SymC.cos]|nr:hypothetical protein AN958_04094 [Leucoagaricus sp. SymC.cos]
MRKLWIRCQWLLQYQYSYVRHIQQKYIIYRGMNESVATSQGSLLVELKIEMKTTRILEKEQTEFEALFSREIG